MTPRSRLVSVDTNPETAAGGRDVIVTRLHRPSHYLAKSRDGGSLEWLPAGLLYRLPRNPSTTGLRGLGRLAFWDHAKTIENRLKAELDIALNPSSISEADRHSGLGVRTNRPRVYIVANPAGGTGGGMFLDLGYLARHVLRQDGIQSSRRRRRVAAAAGEQERHAAASAGQRLRHARRAGAFQPARTRPMKRSLGRAICRCTT